MNVERARTMMPSREIKSEIALGGVHHQLAEFLGTTLRFCPSISEVWLWGMDSKKSNRKIKKQSLSEGDKLETGGKA